MESQILKSALQDIIDHLHYIGNDNVKVTPTEACNTIYKIASTALAQVAYMETIDKVYAVIYEDGDWRHSTRGPREVVGIYDTIQEAEEVLSGIDKDGLTANQSYSIEEWDDYMPY